MGKGSILSDYLREIHRPEYEPVKTREEEQHLLKLAKEELDNKQPKLSLEEIVKRNSRLVAARCRQIAASKGIMDENTIMDLIGVGNISILKAVRNYDISKTNDNGEPIRFSTYLTEVLIKNVTRYYNRDVNLAGKLLSSQLSNNTIHGRVFRVARMLYAEGKTPDVETIARILNRGKKAVYTSEQFSSLLKKPYEKIRNEERKYLKRIIMENLQDLIMVSDGKYNHREAMNTILSDPDCVKERERRSLMRTKENLIKKIFNGLKGKKVILPNLMPVTKADVNRALTRYTLPKVLSINEDAINGESSEEYPQFYSTITYPNTTTPEVNLPFHVRKALKSITPKERKVLTRYYGISNNGNKNKLTLEEIGRELGLTKERIRQIKKKALEKLRKRNSALRDLFEHMLDEEKQAKVKCF